MLNASNWTARLNELATRADVPGAALGIRSDGQQILAAHGVLNTATQVPASTDSVFQVGSITKIWTATMIMQLIDEGQLSLDGHDRDTVGQSAYLRLDPEAGVAACLMTNSAESETLYQELFGEVFGELTGATIPAPLRPAADAPGSAAGSEAPGASGSAEDVDLERHAGRYERMSRRLDVSVRQGQLRIVLTMTGNLAALTGAEPEELTLHPADSSGTRFVLRSRDDEPWVPLSFGRLGDGTPYIYLSGRVTPRVR